MRRIEHESVAHGPTCGRPAAARPARRGSTARPAWTSTWATSPGTPSGTRGPSARPGDHTGARGCEVIVSGDADRLRQVVANLLANTLVHTPPGTPVEVRVRHDGPAAVLEVADHGPGLTPELADKVFERFVRADPAAHPRDRWLGPRARHRRRGRRSAWRARRGRFEAWRRCDVPRRASRGRS